MKIKASLSAVALSMAVTFLSGCALVGANPVYVDATPNNPYGKVYDFSAESGQLAEGEELRFKVAPAEDFTVGKVYVNSTEVEPGDDGYYVWKMQAGVNRIQATYDIIPTIDFVERFKLNIDETTFLKLRYQPYAMDFRRDGIEFMNLPQNGGDFINIVDGDTTHFETKNYGYTVKVRYLGIDTPESTSEVEVWGKSASNYSKDLFNNRAKHVLLQSQGWARGDEDKAATADGNQRSLAYVWYSEVENPTLDDFKCVNLEMVYQGFSQGIGSMEDMGERYYYMFDKATKSAEANGRHRFSSEDDPNYDYTIDRGNAPLDLTMKQIYEARDVQISDDGKKIIGDNNQYIDGKTFVRVRGFVTRVIGYSFYFQDKASYERGEDGSLPEAYGLYVFTYSEHPLRPGDEVSVVGILSVYSGTYQLQGVAWSEFSANPNRNITRHSRNNAIAPIELTAAEFNSKNYDQVFVKLTEEVTFCGKGAGSFSYHYGGVHEVDTNNDKYPFYYSSNKIVFYGKTAANAEVRFTQDQDILLSYGLEKSVSYKFYIGGTNYYYPNHPEYIGCKEVNVANTKNGIYKEPVIDDHGDIASYIDHQIDPNGLLETVHQAKKAMTAGISQKYVSTSGSVSTSCYQITFVSPADVSITGVKA